MQDEALIGEFTHQAEAFDSSPVMSSHQALAQLVELARAAAGERWLEAACGPGIVSRELARRAGSVHGVDLTPAMVELARRRAREAGVANATFAVGDATALELGDASFDGAITRFSLHHVPLPGRVVTELARVVRPGGAVVICDHVADEDDDAAAWHQQIERLRDPSHWATLTPRRLRALGERAGLELEAERTEPFEIDFDEWLARGSGGAGSRELIELALARPPSGARGFAVSTREGARVLTLALWQSRWRRSERS